MYLKGTVLMICGLSVGRKYSFRMCVPSSSSFQTTLWYKSFQSLCNVHDNVFRHIKDQQSHEFQGIALNTNSFQSATLGSDLRDTQHLRQQGSSSSKREEEPQMLYLLSIFWRFQALLLQI